MDATNVKEDVNMDGTKNKSISTVAEPSESPYVCVASDIPGSQDQKTVTVTVTFIGSTTLSLSGVGKNSRRNVFVVFLFDQYSTVDKQCKTVVTCGISKQYPHKCWKLYILNLISHSIQMTYD